MPAEFMFRAMLPVMVTVIADDYAAARQAYADIDGATYSPKFDTGDGPVLAHVAIDDGEPVLDQINQAEPVLCETCQCDGLTGFVVNGKCTNPECPGLCSNTWCRTQLDGGGWNGECGDCADRRASHDDNDTEARENHRDSPHDCPVCRDES
ncbi:hypothetical protein ABZ905_32140 [Streptomyces parvus]|uniref:hypothetical protein n=1 Tax=Streptomyces parvus TaxID=66428 RepID=UPI0033FB7759